jgi:anti-sigma regulatory factor (Ser/Thr protein kinase)
MADRLERVQLTMAEDLLARVETIAWADMSSEMEQAGMVPHLCQALRDAIRVAWSRGDRLGVPDEDDVSAVVDAVVEREIAVHGHITKAFDVLLGAGEDKAEVVVRLWRREPECVSAARRLLRRYLDAWEMDGLADAAELVVSELVTNAVRHAQGPEDWLIETRFEQLKGGILRIEVHDASDAKPEWRELSPNADSGRGLALVDVLTGGRWGVSDRVGVGKLIWAVCTDDGDSGGPVRR